MKRHLLFKSLLLLFALVVGSTSVWADTKTEGFEAATTSTTYNSTQTITTSKSDCGIAWSIYYGSPSTTGAITGDNSCLIRYYTADAKLGYAKTTTGIQGLTNVTFNAKVTNTGNKMGVWYSTDGENWTSIASDVTLTTSSQSKSYDIPNSSTSTTYYIKIGLTTGSSTNKKDLIIDDVVFTYSTGGSAPSISASNVNIAYTAKSGSIAYSVNNRVDGGVLTAAKTAGDWLTVGEVGASSVAFTCSANTGLQRTATVRLTYTYNTTETVTKDVTITQALAPQTYTLASSLTSGKTYVIASGTSGSVKIMGAQTDNNRGTVDGTVLETTLTTEIAPAEVVVYGPDASGYYTLYTTNGYLYAASSSKNYLRSQTTNNLNGKWDIEINDVTKAATIEAQGSNTNNSFRYNSGSTVFSCYSSGQSPVYFFEKADAAVATTTSVKLNGSGYATFATTTALDFQDADDATFSAWEITAISGSTITFNQIKKHVAAGKGILLKGTAGATVILNIMPAGGDALSSNKLVGITEATAVAADTYYGLSGDTFKKVNAGTVPAGKALLPASEVTASARELNFVFDEATDIKQVETSKSIIEGIYNLAGQKVQNPTKGLYIMNGKKVIIK